MARSSALIARNAWRALEPAFGRPCLELLHQLTRRGARLGHVPEGVVRAAQVDAEHQLQPRREWCKRQRLADALERLAVPAEAIVATGDPVERTCSLRRRRSRTKQRRSAGHQPAPVAGTVCLDRLRIERGEVEPGLRRVHRLVPHALGNVADAPVKCLRKRNHQVELRIAAVRNDLREVTPKV